MPRPLDAETIFFGSNPPKLRFVTLQGVMYPYDTANETLHLQAAELLGGTYTAGALLHHLCEKYCRRHRDKRTSPCPAFVKSHDVGLVDGQTADVELHPLPAWERCAGVTRLLDACQTEHERAFLLAYINDRYSDELTWRETVVAAWNERWESVPPSGFAGRVTVLDRLLWATLRYPALIPQVWLNWVGGAPDDLHLLVHTKPSRVDFVAYHAGARHVVEIDGPTHWAEWNGQGYIPNEKAYKRTLVIQRSLRSDGWIITPIARLEVIEAMEAKGDFLPWLGPLSVLPFYASEYNEPPTFEELGVPELEAPPDVGVVWGGGSDDDIPF